MPQPLAITLQFTDGGTYQYDPLDKPAVPKGNVDMGEWVEVKGTQRQIIGIKFEQLPDQP